MFTNPHPPSTAKSSNNSDPLLDGGRILDGTATLAVLHPSVVGMRCIFGCAKSCIFSCCPLGLATVPPLSQAHAFGLIHLCFLLPLFPTLCVCFWRFCTFRSFIVGFGRVFAFSGGERGRGRGYNVSAVCPPEMQAQSLNTVSPLPLPEPLHTLQAPRPESTFPKPLQQCKPQSPAPP